MKICFLTDISNNDVFGKEFIEYFKKNNDVTVITFNDEIKTNLFSKVMYTKKMLKVIKPDVLMSCNADGPAFISALSGFHPFVLFSYGSDVSYHGHRMELSNLIVKYVVFKADVIVSQDKMIYERLLQLGVKPNKIVLKHWGVDSCFYHIGNKNKKYDVVNIHGYNTTYYRYVDVFLKTVSILDKRGVELKSLLIGNNGYYDKVIHRFGLTTRVLEQKSFLKPKEFRDVLWESKLMVDCMYPPYHDGCGYGIGLVQAMSCGTPVICADRRVIKLGGVDKWFYGMVFKHNDSIQLADKIECLLNDDVALKTISSLNRKSVEKNFDKTKNMFFIENEIKKKVDVFYGRRGWNRV